MRQRTWAPPLRWRWGFGFGTSANNPPPGPRDLLSRQREPDDFAVGPATGPRVLPVTVPGGGGRPLVSFVGAGPGDPELITLKGLRRLREADVVVRDRLVPAALVEEASSQAEVIDVGKAPGRHCIGQDQINRLLVDQARAGRLVVRLKGGDPTIFGRLAEEVRTVREAGLPVEIVPGVTAATAGAARAGISLTERRGASMVVLATATDHTGGLTAALDWRLLARAQATLVFYMSTRGLEAITATLIALGRDPQEPALVAERVGTLAERIIVGRLAGIAAAARTARVASPAVVISGPTVVSALAELDPSRLRTVCASERVEAGG